ncbi:glycosyltransferase family 4 protein [Natronorubrum daqingense]|uniref:Glycosyl transferase family 1 n=1 Tax=Natronorubrum daqingense TaxID=588898 RepID=A0A1N7CRH6_9EURY|nr:glycosyltransferase family 4 protein [Natronorubrum daqingense]APX97030.1 glycosyl transferase family 1 [Natronorubrum daqingense]SIR66236.1 Glycosyltransferase involved in cell wall bisynthesis [Natronorubrum daqingense]
MQIAFVSIETVHHHDTEANRRCQTVLEVLRDHGHDVHCFCAKFWDDESPSLERDDITYHAVTDDVASRRSFCLRLPFDLAAESPDVVHASARPPTTVLAAAGGAMLARTPLLVEWYGDDGVADDSWTQRAAKRGDRLVAPSELVATWVRERGGDGDRVETIPNPIDIDSIQEVSPGERVDVVYARRLDEGANLESLLLGLAELRDRDWSTTVIGDGPEREAYERLASDLRIDDRITFAGECSLEERLAAYRGAHVFAQTAERCVFPTEMCWALASGCVGIVEYHANSSAHELVEGWDRGFRTTSEEELADAILEAGNLEYRDFDDRFGAYDESVIGDRYLEQYRTLRDEQGLL